MRPRAAVVIAAVAFTAVVATATRAQNIPWPLERPPRPLPAREVKFPPYEMRTLQNGMQVVTVLHHEQPAVSMRLLVRAGSIQDPPGKIGVAALAASLLDQGTTTKTSEQIADHIDFIGGALAAGSGSDLTFANVVVMKDSFGVGMDLLGDVIRNPAFAPAEIERQKQQTMSSLQVSANDPDYVASMLLERLVYGFHPYGLPNSGTPETLAQIERADLQAYHRRYFVPNNMILAIVGDVTNDEAFAAADRVFGTWPRGDVPPVTVTEPPQATRRIVIVDKPDSVQTEIRVGQIAIPRKHDDYMAWDLAVKILGGEGANRLHRVLRSERGLTYGAQADTQARKQAGHFAAETDTRTETTGEALRLMVDEFAKLQRDRVGQAELLDAQAYLAGSFPLTIETPNDIAAQVLNVLFYELPVEEIGTFRERVQAVTPDAVQRVAREYVKPDRLSIVLVGDATSFVPQLKQAGFNEFEIIPIADLDLMSATLRREAPRPPARAAAAPSGRDLSTPLHLAYSEAPGGGRPNAARTEGPQASDAAALALLQRVIDAKGGVEALKNVRTVTADSQTTLHLDQGPLVSKTRTYVSYPDKFRVDASVAGAEVIQVYNAGNAWVRDPRGVHDAPPAMRDDFAASVRRDIIPLLLAAADGRVRVRVGPPPAAGLQSLHVGDPAESGVLLVVDSRGLVVKQTFSTPGPDGRRVEAEESFSDYRRVNGVMVPYRADVSRGGRVVLSRTLTAVTLNAAIDAGMFDRPQ